MPRHKEPVSLILAKGRTHLTRTDIERRMAEEIQVPFTDVQPPDYLTGEKARTEFMGYAEKLLAIGIFTELDVDTLARYILSKNLYLQYTAELTKMIQRHEDTREMRDLQNMQDKAFRQCHACAGALGLTITSRCKLTVPQVDNEEDYEL